MTPDDFLNLLENPEFISGIYNYCDRWCERCKMTSKCSLYASEQIVDKEFEGTDLPEEEVFMKKLHQSFSMTFQLLERASAEHGINLNFTEEEKESSLAEHRAHQKEAQESPIAVQAKNYTNLAKKWMDASREKLLEKENQMNQALLLNLPGDDPEKEAAALTDAIEVISWYLYQIFVKVSRAYNSRREELQYINEPDDEEFPKDSDSSAKIALIGINSSIAAWTTFLQAFPDSEESLLEILSCLTKLKRMVEEEFPNAPYFIRPGFED